VDHDTDVRADGSDLRLEVMNVQRIFGDELLPFGLSKEKVEVDHQKRSFVDADIFLDWFRGTFLPELLRRREMLGYGRSPHLLLDNCSTHTREEFRASCRAERVQPVSIPPHSSHFVQPLDRSLFGLVKKRVTIINKAFQIAEYNRPRHSRHRCGFLLGLNLEKDATADCEGVK
jgi:hypothetical protein